jgi:hypothetical protein
MTWECFAHATMTDPSPDAFAAVADLIRLIADPDGCAKRIRELQKLGDQLAKAQAQLAADRAASVAALSAADEREKTLRDREVKVTLGEPALTTGLQELAAARRVLAPRYPHDPNIFWNSNERTRTWLRPHQSPPLHRRHRPQRRPRPPLRRQLRKALRPVPASSPTVNMIGSSRLNRANTPE